MHSRIPENPMAPVNSHPTRFLSILLGLLFSLLGLCRGVASDIIGTPQVTVTSPTSVAVRWQTDVPTGSRVYYGLSADQLNHRANGALSDSHEVIIQDLQPGTPYFFAVATAKKRLATGSFSTSSSGASAVAPASSSPASKEASSASAPLATAAPSPTPVSRFSLSSLFKRSTGSSPAGAPAVQAPPARATWGNPSSLPDHFARHGADFGARDQEEYARMAWELGQRAKTEHLPTKIDDYGVRRVYDPRTGAFAAYNRDGTTKTFFKPGSPGYFDRQPGRLITN